MRDLFHQFKTPQCSASNLMHMVTVGYTPASNLMPNDAVDDEARQGTSGGDHSDNLGQGGVVNWEDLFGADMNDDLDENII